MKALSPSSWSASLLSGLVVCGLAVGATACNSQERTEEMIQARLDAERVKTLEASAQELKAANDTLSKENEALKLQIATLEAKVGANVGASGQRRPAPVSGPTTAAKPAPRTTKPTSGAGGKADSKMTPAEVSALHDAATGGGSFK
jgi:hypothetical protein